MKRAKLLAALVCLIPLCGCVGSDRGREPENTVLAEVVGVDRMGERWFVTGAGKDDAGETVIQTAEGDSLAEAFAALPGVGETWMSVTGVHDFLLGDGVEIREVLLYILDDSGMSWRARVWHAPIAGALVKEQGDGGGDRLTVLEQSGTQTVSVLDVLSEWEDGGETALPALVMRDGVLMASGMIYYERWGKGSEQ